MGTAPPGRGVEGHTRTYVGAGGWSVDESAAEAMRQVPGTKRKSDQVFIPNRLIFSVLSKYQATIATAQNIRQYYLPYPRNGSPRSSACCFLVCPPAVYQH